MTTSKSTADLVASRTVTHGDFTDHARCTQHLKLTIDLEVAARHDRGQPPLSPTQRESVDMILHKIGRIVAGDASFQDHWDDIAGYARIANGQR
jgi:hypothetical protein